MNRTTSKNRKLVISAMLGAITMVLGLTPLGIIPMGLINPTTMHIPVIVAAIAEGPIVGAMVGLIFGVFSLLNAILRNASPVAFVFYNPLISVVPRILIGITSYYSYIALKKVSDKNLKGLTQILWIAIIGFLSFLMYKNITTGASPLNITFVGILIVLSIGLFVYSLKTTKQDFPIALGAFIGSMTNTILVLGGISNSVDSYAQPFVCEVICLLPSNTR